MGSLRKDSVAVGVKIGKESPDKERYLVKALAEGKGNAEWAVEEGAPIVNRSPDQHKARQSVFFSTVPAHTHFPVFTHEKHWW